MWDYKICTVNTKSYLTFWQRCCNFCISLLPGRASCVLFYDKFCWLFRPPIVNRNQPAQRDTDVVWNCHQKDSVRRFHTGVKSLSLTTSLAGGSTCCRLIVLVLGSTCTRDGANEISPVRVQQVQKIVSFLAWNMILFTNSSSTFHLSRIRHTNIINYRNCY